MTPQEKFELYKKTSLPVVKVTDFPLGTTDDPIIPDTLYLKKTETSEVTMMISSREGDSMIPLLQRDSLTSVANLDELRSLQVTRATICFVMNDNVDPTAEPTSGFYYYKIEQNEWVKFSSDIFGNIEERDGVLVYNGQTIALASSNVSSSTSPMFDTLYFDFITGTTFALKIRIASLNGYYPVGLKIKFQVRYIDTGSVWNDILVTPFTSGTMEYGFIYPSVDTTKTHLFRCLFVDDNNPGLLIESGVITGNNVTADTLPDIILPLEESLLNRNTIYTDNGDVFENPLSGNKVIAGSNNTSIRSLVISVPDTTKKFARVKVNANVQTNRIYMTGTPTLTEQSIITKEELPNKFNVISDTGMHYDLTPTTLPVIQSRFYLGSDHTHNPFKYTLTGSGDWKTVANILGSEVTYKNDITFDGINAFRVSGEGSNQTTMYSTAGIYNKDLMFFANMSTVSARYPKALKDYAFFKNEKYIYMIGGEFNNSSGYLSNILRLNITNTLVAGAFVDTGKVLPINLSGHLAVPIHNYLYVLGSSSSIYRAVILESGDLGDFTLYRDSVPLAAKHSQVIVTEKRIFVLGGAVSGVPISDIYSMDILDDGSLGIITKYGDLPYAVTGHKCINSSNQAYLVGGQLTGTNLYSDKVIRYDIDDTFSLVNLTYDKPLPYKVAYGSLYMTHSSMTYLGGTNGTYQKGIIYRHQHGWKTNRDPRYSKYTLNITVPGTISPISLYNKLPEVSVYMGQGYSFKTGIENINVDKETITTSLSNWLTVPAGFKIRDGVVFATSKNVYMMNGYLNSLTIPFILKSTRDANDNLTNISSDLINPSLYRLTTPVKIYDKLHLIGNNYGLLNRYAKIKDDGVLDDWNYSRVGFLDVPKTYPRCTVTGKYMYAFGLSTAGNKINRFTLSHDGALTEVERLSLTTPTSFIPYMSFKINDRIYIFPDNTKTIYYTTVDVNDNLTTFTNAGIDLPVNLTGYGYLVTKKKIWILGGYSGTTYRNITLSASIDVNGVIGPWVTDVNLPIPMAYFNTLVINNKLYLIGGRTTGNADITNMYVASFDGWDQLNITGNHDDAINTLAIINKTTDLTNGSVSLETELLNEIDPTSAIALKVNSGDLVNNLTGNFWYL